MLPAIILYVVITLAAILALKFIWRLVKNIIIFLAIPGPPVDWLLRHEVSEFSSSSEQIKLFFNKWKQRYPRICRFFVGPMPYVSVSHPESLKEIIKHKLPKHPLYKTTLSAWLGDGLLLSNGDKWFRHRRMLTPAFHYNILESFMSVYESATRVMLQQWEEAAQKDGYIVLQNSVPYLSLDILLQCIGSLETECQIEKENLQYVRDVQDLTEISLKRYSNPLYMLDWYFYCTKYGRVYKKACSRSRSYTRDLILHRKRILLESSNNRDYQTSDRKSDFLSILLTAKDENGRGLTDEEICDEVDTFVFEGHDTTSTGLMWVLYHLAKYPKFQEMCRREVIECVEGSKLTQENLSKLEFLTMFIKESLRLCPPVYSVARETEQPLTIDGYELPKGTFLILSFNQLHWNPEFWPDPFKFDPYRFSLENQAKIDPYTYLPFSVGQRNCIGQNLAMHEIKSVVSIVLKRYDIELHSSIADVTIAIKKDLLYKPENPLKLILKRTVF